MKIKNLAEFKRYLKTKEAEMEIIYFNDKSFSPKPHKWLNKRRKIKKVQTNAVEFEEGSWLYFDKAENYVFHENSFDVLEEEIEYNIFTCQYEGTGKKFVKLTYRYY